MVETLAQAARLREETPRVAAVLDPLAGADDIQAGSLAAFSLLLEILPLVANDKPVPART